MMEEVARGAMGGEQDSLKSFPGPLLSTQAAV